MPASPATAAINQVPTTTDTYNFAGSTYIVSGVQYVLGSVPNWTLTRASQAYSEDLSGLLNSFTSGTPRVTNKGILLEESRTNVALWCRDMTNAAWTKSNVTAAKTQTGADGSANSASLLTATAGNGTCLQAITLASSQRAQSAYVKRITGTGAIQMTTDNGSTWTAITTTANYQQLRIPAQTLANPTIGFRIVTSGDAIAVDFVQNENGEYPTSPILTTTVAVTRAADVASLARSLGDGQTLVVWFTEPRVTTSASARLIGTDNANAPIFLSSDGQVASYNGAVMGAGWNALTAGVAAKVGLAVAVGGARTMSVNSETPQSGTGGFGANTTIYLGSNAGSADFSNPYIACVFIYPRALTGTELQAITT